MFNKRILQPSIYKGIFRIVMERGGRGRGRWHHRSSRGSRHEEHGHRHTHNRSEGGEHRGLGRGRLGGPPPGLRGKEIGMWFAQRSKEKTARLERENRSVVELDGACEEQLSNLLTTIRTQNQPDGTQSQSASRNSMASSSKPISSEEGADWFINAPDVETLCSEEMEPISFKEQFAMQREANKQANSGQQPWAVDSDKAYLIKDPRFDVSQLERLQQQRTSPKYQRMQACRERLPSYKAKQDILNTIADSQVTVISGETGCGKTTQVAQFLLDEAIEQQRASLCRIVCTQPRRISAISVAERVADERCETLGGSNSSVGFQIRLERKLPTDRGSILYCTTGIVLQWLAGNPLLRGVSHVILDEIHERDLQSDFLMILLRDLLPRRPDLKLVLMSATLNAEMFSQYFGNCPMMHIPGYTFPVADFLLEDVIEMIRYRPSGNSRGRNCPRQFGKARREQQEEEARYLEWCKHLEHSRQYSSDTVATLRELDHSDIDVDLAVSLAAHITRFKPEGAILVFMPGWEKIKKMHDALKANPLFGPDRCRIIPLHSLMPTVNQREVFSRPPTGVRKIVIATNIAETSITIDDVVYVIDGGRINMKKYDAENNISTLRPEWVSKANARQRRGRAGRVQPGECYHLFTRYHLDGFADYQLPEMLRTRLEELCLHIKLLCLGRVLPLVSRALQPPSLDALGAALTTLRQLNALDDEEELTPLGLHLARMPVDPHTGKMLLFGAMFSCLDPVLTVAASLSYKDAFHTPLGKEQESDRRRRELARGSQSDHLMLANAYSGWERAFRDGNQEDYCRRNFLSPNVLKLLRDMRSQFSRLLHEMQFLSSPDPKAAHSNLHSDKDAIVKAVICAGLYPNVAKIHHARKQEGKGAPSRLYTQSEKVTFHMKSVNSQEAQPQSQYCVYHLKQKTSLIQLYDSTFVSPLSLLLLGGRVQLQEENSESGGATEECTVIVDGWIHFSAPTRVAHLVIELREQLDRLLQDRITQPGPTRWHGDHTEAAIMNSIIDLLYNERITKAGDRQGWS